MAEREVRRTTPADAAAARALLDSPEPLVLTGLIERWPARRWTPSSLGRQFPEARLCVRLHPRGLAAVWEAECVQQAASLGDFCSWLEGDQSCEGSDGLARFRSGNFVGYADYQDMGRLFDAAPAALAAVDWRDVGVDRDGSQSTLWLGSEGAHTPTHYDAYGVNLVAQLHGTKRWRLHPPDAPLVASRLPYEESSIYCEGAADGDDRGVRGCREVLLVPGEVLLVPRHWWHHVTTLSPTALSANTWLDAPTDAADRLREAMVRTLLGALMRANDADGADGAATEPTAAAAASDAEPPAWLNPTEELWSHADNVAALQVALRTAHPECSARDIVASDLVNALCTGPALDAALVELRRRCARAPGRGQIHDGQGSLAMSADTDTRKRPRVDESSRE